MILVGIQNLVWLMNNLYVSLFMTLQLELWWSGTYEIMVYQLFTIDKYRNQGNYFDLVIWIGLIQARA